MITLRSKLTKKGYSLYLDFYKDGERACDFLGIHVSQDYTSKNATKRIKPEDKEKFELAKTIALKSQLYGISAANNIVTKEKKGANFIDYFDTCYQERKNGHRSYTATLFHLKRYGGDKVKFSQLNEEWIKGFSAYLQGQESMKDITRHLYLKRTDNIIVEAVKDGILKHNPCKEEVTQARKKVVQKEISYLTEDELKKLRDTPTDFNVTYRNMFFFACYTGLRLSDVKSLKWSEIKGSKLATHQEKTKELIYIDMHPSVVTLLEEIKAEQAPETLLVFDKSGSERGLNSALKRWAEKAEIGKNIHFHVSRHSFATNLLSNGAGIHTVQKLLGHKSINSTLVYAKVTDKVKKDAIYSLANF